MTPEFAEMSRSRGIGYDWYKKYSGDLYPSDECIVNGNVCRPPKFYDKLLERDDPELYMKIKAGRLEHRDKYDDQRLFKSFVAKQKSIEQRMELLVRSMEAEA